MAKGGSVEFDVKINGYWQTCPICVGRGFVAAGFYDVPAGYVSSMTGTAPVSCRRCHGTGTVEVPASTRTRGDQDG